jgi:hypothetical protein
MSLDGGRCMRRATCISQITILYQSTAKAQNADRFDCTPQSGIHSMADGTELDSLQGYLNCSRSLLCQHWQSDQPGLRFVMKRAMVKWQERKTGHSLLFLRAPRKQSSFTSTSEHNYKMGNVQKQIELSLWATFWYCVIRRRDTRLRRASASHQLYYWARRNKNREDMDLASCLTLAPRRKTLGPLLGIWEYYN